MYFELGISATVDEYACEQGGAFFAVKDAEKSVVFYIDGLGFEFKNKWVEDGVIRWCHLLIGEAGLMLQQFRTHGHDSRLFRDKKGEGVTLCFFCDDAVGFYRDVTSRGIDASEPFVGNMMWVTEMTDPTVMNSFLRAQRM